MLNGQPIKMQQMSAVYPEFMVAYIQRQMIYLEDLLVTKLDI
jgi:hypothetical protein